MGAPISIRLDDDVRDELEAQARSRGIGLATLPRDLATEAARAARRARIREGSAAVGAHLATEAEGRSFYGDWDTPCADAGRARPARRQIMLADWRGEARPKEPDKPHPAAVVEDDGLFAPSYPNAVPGPLTEDAALAIPDLAVAIAPTAENGCIKPCWAVSHLVATTAKARLRPTSSRIAADELAAIRRQIALAVGIA